MRCCCCYCCCCFCNCGKCRISAVHPPPPVCLFPSLPLSILLSLFCILLYLFIYFMQSSICWRRSQLSRECEWLPQQQQQQQRQQQQQMRKQVRALSLLFGAATQWETLNWSLNDNDDKPITAAAVCDLSLECIFPAVAAARCCCCCCCYSRVAAVCCCCYCRWFHFQLCLESTLPELFRFCIFAILPGKRVCYSTCPGTAAAATTTVTTATTTRRETNIWCWNRS